MICSGELVQRDQPLRPSTVIDVAETRRPARRNIYLPLK
jgi:hypothetical protein